MDEPAVAEALMEWAMEATDIETGYDYPVSAKLGALPDVAVAIGASQHVGEHPRFAFHRLQQVWLLVFEAELSIMVEVGESEADARTAQHALYGYAATLRASILADATLGERVPVCSPDIRADFSTPFVEYADGTRGRVVLLDVAVAELVGAPA